MTEHIIWAVIWAVIAVIFYMGGGIFAWVTGVASVIFRKAPTARSAIGSIALGVIVLLLAWAFAVFAVIKCILQIVAAFQS